MNILYVVQYWPSLFEAYMSREVRWMTGRGHRVAIVSLDSAGPMGFRTDSNRHAEPVGDSMEGLPVLQLDSKTLSSGDVVAETLAFARRHETQLIDAHFAREPAETACRAHLASGIPFTVRMRGGDVHTNVSPSLARIVACASAVCPVSQFLADVLVGRRRLKRIPEGIPLDVAPGKLRVLPYNLSAKYLSRQPVEQSDDVQVIGSIGRVVPLKRFQDIVQAVAELVSDFPGVRLQIVGDGPMTADLIESADKAGIGAHFEITGFKRWGEVMNLAGRFHIYVQASELEGFCLTAIEAGFKGIPLVLSKTGIHEECVEPGINGYLFDPGDVRALVESLRLLLLAGASRRREMGAASLEIVGRRFSEEKVMPRIESVFQAAISGSILPG